METHYVILARVQDAKVTSDYNPMTYKYYHEVIKGKAPKKCTYLSGSRKITDKETWLAKFADIL